LFSVYGPRDRPDKLYSKLIRCILEGETFPLYEGSETHQRSYSYIGDAIDGLTSALDNFDRCIGEIFNIGTDVTHTTAEAISTVEGVIGRSARVATAPRRPGDQLRTHANIEKARRILGYNPTTTLRQGIHKTVEWYRCHILGRIRL
jgi:nucleoside-diphosphate-sugar epimerase